MCSLPQLRTALVAAFVAFFCAQAAVPHAHLSAGHEHEVCSGHAGAADTDDAADADPCVRCRVGYRPRIAPAGASLSGVAEPVAQVSRRVGEPRERARSTLLARQAARAPPISPQLA
jgi:hypothetical protein